MLDEFPVIAFVGICFVSALPQASALKWEICNKDEAGKEVCRKGLTQSARYAIVAASFGVLLILVILIICVVKNRQKSEEEAQEYNVEASQMHGPPTIIGTEYHPNGGPTGLLTCGGRLRSPDMRQLNDPSPTFPVPVYYPGASPTQNHSAPVMPARFASHGVPGSANLDVHHFPQTAFVTGGFPRQMLSGQRLKDRIKERPDSVSSFESFESDTSTESITPPPSSK